MPVQAVQSLGRQQERRPPGMGMDIHSLRGHRHHTRRANGLRCVQPSGGEALDQLARAVSGLSGRLVAA
ncbi:hypothetical protein GCM10009735_37730 [Actinomadura chokoriensis]